MNLSRKTFLPLDGDTMNQRGRCRFLSDGHAAPCSKAFGEDAEGSGESLVGRLWETDIAVLYTCGDYRGLWSGRAMGHFK